ncbi:DUF1365 domain-containing protein [uncultured Cohaesibacter sp.]|uniref:DUF1365 domain-containing protein n=1 Tax=uncultured Cohaesibacter sp. TaxID=1002546 RepID=UPI0029C9AE69|nr:DUF1365 domain-containing protein [uncultured Cohaesibacter sp.]
MTNSAPSKFAPAPCLYEGVVTHIRSGALEHRLAYKVTSLLLPLDQLKQIDRISPLFSINRFNLISFHEADYIEPPFESLQGYLEHLIEQSGEFPMDGERPTRFVALTFPRLLGRAFNPLTIFFCCDSENHLRAILYQVSNTFGQRHHYIYRLANDESNLSQDARLRHEGKKIFYVSPFLDIAGEYSFSIRLPHEKLSYQIGLSGGQPSALMASFVAQKKPFNTRNLLLTFVRLVQSGWKILAAIHLEALKLWRKGAPFYKRPAAPSEPVSALHRSKFGKGLHQ